MADAQPETLTSFSDALRHRQNLTATVEAVQNDRDPAPSPPHADVISAGENDSNSTGCSSSEFLRIKVSNPKKEVEAVGKVYVTYLVTTSTNLPEYGGASFEVRRRFREVVALADRLREAYRGYFIPRRPDKNVVERQVMQNKDFVEQRRIALERYLGRLGRHPLIRVSGELRAFLRARGDDVASSVDLEGMGRGLKDVSLSKFGGMHFLWMFKEIKQAVSNDWSGARPPVIDEDRHFLEKKRMLLYLEKTLADASQQAESLVKDQQRVGETMGDLGLTLIKLTKFESREAGETTQSERTSNMKSVATAAITAGRLYREANVQTIKNLATLHECMGLMLAVHTAFSDRANALLTLQTLISELAALNSRAEKLEIASSKRFADDKLKRKIEELKETIRFTEDSKSRAAQEYERIKENNRNEIERLDRERKADFMNMLKGFVTNQVACNEKIRNEWTKVVEETSGFAKESG